MRLRNVAAFAVVGMLACGAPPKLPERSFQTVPISPLLQGDERLIEFEDHSQRPGDLVWHSTNESIAKVTPEGRVRGMAPGAVVVQGASSKGSIDLRVKVSAARLAWTRLVPLGTRTFVTVADGKAIFAKSVKDRRCSWDCPGELHVVSLAGEPVTAFTGIGRVVAGTSGWFEAAGEIVRYDYATALTSMTGLRGKLFGLYAEGDLLLGDGIRLMRVKPDGTVVSTREFSGEVQRAVIAADMEIVMADRRLFLARPEEITEVIATGPRIPWATDRSGAAILSDSAGFNFAVYRASSGYRLLSGLHSVLVAPSGLLESEGLTAALSVPLAALADGGAVFVEMHTYGSAGVEHTFDIVRREDDLLQWRWGPSKCNDHPFAMAALPGFAILAGCDRILRIDDATLTTAGSWPQPGADAARSWRVQ